MNHPSSKTKRKLFSKKLIVIVITLALVGVGLFVVYTHAIGTTFLGTKAPVVPKSADSSHLNQDTNDPAPSAPSETDQSSKTSTQQQVPPSQISVHITSKNQDASFLRIRSIIDTVLSEGSCTLVLSNGSTTITKQADIQTGPSYSTCKGFDISKTELTQTTWTINLTVSASGMMGSTNDMVSVE